MPKGKHELAHQMHYDANFKSIVVAVEKQLKLRIRIPASFREYGIKVIERWHKEEFKWLRGGTLKFCDPHAD